MLLQLLFFISFNSFGAPINHYPIFCEGDCPAYVAGVWNKENRICTGVLVAPDVVATNLHCLPKDLQFAGASCANSIFISFPKTVESPEDVIECDHVLHVSPPIQDPALTMDYALLHLKKMSTRSLVHVDTSGIDDDEPITLFKVDPQDDGKKGVIRRDQCRAVQKSIYNPLFISKETPIISLIPCSVVQGNSGSPMISANGSLKGLINSTLVSPDNLDNDKKISAANGTSFTCLNVTELGITGKAASSLCRSSPTSAVIQKASADLASDELKKAQDSFNNDLETQRRKLNDQSKQLFIWKTEQTSYSLSKKTESPVTEVSYVPQCISLSRKIVEQKIKSLKSDDIIMTIEIPKISLYFQNDPVGRFKGRTAITHKTSELRLKPVDLLKEKVPLRLDGKSILLPFCIGT